MQYDYYQKENKMIKIWKFLKSKERLQGAIILLAIEMIIVFINIVIKYTWEIYTIGKILKFKVVDNVSS